MHGLCCVLTVLCAACGGGMKGPGERTVELTEIEALERQVGEWIHGQGSVDWGAENVEQVVGQLLRGYATYANHHHGDSLATVFQMRRAELLLGKGAAAEAIRQWVDVVEGNPASGWAAEAMFRVGFTRETALRDTTGALEAYVGVIEAYPESPWAEQARQASTWLTFNEREMIRSLGAGS